MSSKIDSIKALREMTGIGMSQCKDALEKSGYDIGRALELLREWGAISAAEKRDRKVSEGYVASYTHGDGRIGVLLQLDCESDFVSRNDDFRKFSRDLCMQIAAMNPKFISRSDISDDALHRERTLLRASALQSKKPAAMIDKIVEGQLEKWFSAVCLLDQAWIFDNKLTVQGQLNELVQKTRENIRVTRFSRFEAGTVADIKEG